MAIIKCPDCGKEISDSAPACIGCGRPIAALNVIKPNSYSVVTRSIQFLKAKKLLLILLFAIGSVAYISVGKNWIKRTILSPGKVTSLEEANISAPGVWIGQIEIPGSGVYYEKFVLSPGGTGKRYCVSVAANGWGEPTNSDWSWSAKTSKYPDTGNRWYGIEMRNGEYPFSDKDTIVSRDETDSSNVYYRRGDVFPFSK